MLDFDSIHDAYFKYVIYFYHLLTGFILKSNWKYQIHSFWCTEPRALGNWWRAGRDVETRTRTKDGNQQLSALRMFCRVFSALSKFIHSSISILHLIIL